MSDIDDFISEQEKNSPFVKFEDGEPITGTLLEKKLVDDTFNPGEKVMRYTLEIEGVKKNFKSKSVKLARMMKPIKEGEEIELVKTGSQFQTVWYVSRKDKPATKQDNTSKEEEEEKQ